MNASIIVCVDCHEMPLLSAITHDKYVQNINMITAIVATLLTLGSSTD